MTIRVYNTLSRTKEPFEPVTLGKVGIYLCGPTVYKEAHIGHMVGPVIFDTIKRYLVYNGLDVTWVVNVTDVDDKLIAQANKRGITMAEVAEEMTADYLKNLVSLGVDQIDRMPRATEHIDAIVAFIEKLIEKDFAYESQGDVYFEVGKNPEYGKLSNRTADAMQGEGGDTAARKRAPGDFALWKGAKPGEPSWPSPWGDGRPGWHIECSVMGGQLLGETFDIHGGGLDLLFPHHENEIAQSECCHGKPMAKYWMHNGLMKAAGEAGKVGGRTEREAALSTFEDADTKISRSKGAGGLAELIARQGGERIRFFLLRSHYRSTIVFGEDGLQEAGRALDTFYRFFERLERATGQSFYDLPAPATRTEGRLDPGDDELLAAVAKCRDDFIEKMDDDFNTGAAVSDLFELVRVLNRYADRNAIESAGADSPLIETLRRGTATLKELAGILGIFTKPIEKETGGDSELVDALMGLVIQIRKQARENKDYATSDQIRDTLGELGITLEDRKEGTGWRLEG